MLTGQLSAELGYDGSVSRDGEIYVRQRPVLTARETWRARNESILRGKPAEELQKD